MDDLKVAMESHRVDRHASPRVVQAPPGSISPFVAQTWLKVAPADNRQIVHFIKVVEDHTNEFDLERLKVTLERGEIVIDELPDILKPVEQPPRDTKVQIAIAPQTNNVERCTIFKWYNVRAKLLSGHSAAHHSPHSDDHPVRAWRKGCSHLLALRVREHGLLAVPLAVTCAQGRS